MTYDEVSAIVADVKYWDWEIKAGQDNGHTFLWIEFVAPCNVTGQVERQECRRWWIKPEADKAHVVRTAFKAVLTAMEHEARETFKYRGRSIFDPHLDIDTRWTRAGSLQ